MLRRVDADARRGPVYRAYARLAATRPVGWVSRHLAWKLDPWLLRLTGGRVGAGLMLPTAVLETRGARTGALRRNALVYFHDGDAVIVVASHLGLPRHPGWYHNVVANPAVTMGGEPFTAEVVGDPTEQARLWAAADRVFPFGVYRARAAAAGRTIPIVRLHPVEQR